MPNCSRCGRSNCYGCANSPIGSGCKFCGHATCQGNCTGARPSSHAMRCAVCGETYSFTHFCKKYL